MMRSRPYAKWFWIAAAVLVAVPTARAQITIDVNDFSGSPGDQWMERQGTCVLVAADATLAGADVHWDFSQQDTLELQTVPHTLIDPAESRWPNVNRVVEEAIQFMPGFYAMQRTHVNMSAESVLFRALDSHIEPLMGDTTEAVFEPGLVTLDFPCNFGDTWSTEASGVIYVNGIQGDSLRTRQQYHADGWGTLVTPFSSYSCLRLERVTEDWDFGSESWGVADTEFVWLADGIGMVMEIRRFTRAGGEARGDLSMIDLSVGIDAPSVVPPAPAAELIGNYPNPFNPLTTIEFRLDRKVETQLSIYDLRGRKVVTLVDRILPAGHHFEPWDGRDWSGRTLSSGIYIYRLRAGSLSDTRRMILLK
jgi:hypothetical protein